jgi:diguanylate cyclase
VSSRPVSKARQAAEEAFALMVERDIPPTPENFAIWFKFSDKSDDGLVRALDILISNEQYFDQFRNLSLFEEFILPKMAAAAIGAVAHDLDGAAGSLTQAITVAGRSADEYGLALDQAESQLSLETGPTSLSAVVESLQLDTRQMQEHNHNLQRDLVSSRGVIAELHERLAESIKEAETDGLTGIANRKRFDKELRDAAMVAMENGSDLSLLMADIDF